MEFSRVVFYQLRDLAVLLRGSRTHLRYSCSDLELSYEYHTEQKLGPGLHWVLLLLGTGSVVMLLYKLLIYIKQPIWPWSILLLVLIVVSRFIQSPTPTEAVYAGVIRLNYTAGAAYCYFFSIKPQNQHALPLGPEIPLGSICSIRVRVLSLSSSDEPNQGLVEVQLTKAGPWLLFAQLPTMNAARQAAALLCNLTGLAETTLTDKPLAPGILSLARYLGRQYYKLSNDKLR